MILHHSEFYVVPIDQRKESVFYVEKKEEKKKKEFQWVGLIQACG